MKNIFLCLFLSFLPLTLSAQGQKEQEVPNPTARAHARLFKGPIGENLLSVNVENAEGWHTYWKNPGDAGLPLKVEFQSAGAPLSPAPQELEWPVPELHIEEGDMWAFGYEGAYSLFFSLDPAVLQGLEGKELQVNVGWLICKHVCVPGKAELKGVVKDGNFEASLPADYSVPQDEIGRRLAELPQPADRAQELDLVLALREEKKLALYYNLSPKDGALPTKNQGLLMPMPALPMNYKHESLYKGSDGQIYGRLDIDWDGEYQEPPVDLPADGKFAKAYTLRFLYFPLGEAAPVVIEKSFESFSTEAAPKLEAFLKGLTPLVLEDAAPLEGQSSSTGDESTSLAFYLLLAFVGGLILNIMPCVLPVISLKLFALAKSQDKGRSAMLKHNLLYSAGVVVTFLLLAGLIVILKSAGTHVGWGFQLQSPSFVLLMLAVLFIMALNLFGLFDFVTPGGTVLGNVRTDNGPVGDFMGGVLATILATPCSAPFLGTALTFAFSSSSGTIFLVFTAIGLGLASPFILTGLLPVLVNFLPRPGAWMEHVKKFLGLTLILSVVWLIDVFVALTVDWGTLPLLQALTGLALAFFAFYFNRHIGEHISWRVLFFAAPVAAFIWCLATISTPKLTALGQGVDVGTLAHQNSTEGAVWEPWSEARMKELQAQGKPVFIDFTARWCFTCKVNERLVLDTRGFRDLAQEKGLTLLLADWTRRDEVIGSWLKRQGLVGVPAYFVQTKEGKLIPLGETISLSEIREALP